MNVTDNEPRIWLEIADLEIKVSAGWDEMETGQSGLSLNDFVRVTALNLSLMNVDDRNNVTKARYSDCSEGLRVALLI